MLRFLLVAIAACATSTVMAQSDPGPHGLVLDEIIVTATKRRVEMQDVPIALSVVTGDKIEAMGMVELEDVALYMPNVHIAEGAITPLLFIRGIGSGLSSQWAHLLTVSTMAALSTRAPHFSTSNAWKS